MEEATTENNEGREDAIQKTEDMAASLLKKRDAAIVARAADGCEQRMRVDQETYDAGLSDDSQNKLTAAEYAAGKAKPQNATGQGSQLVVNIVRGRSEVVAGRLISAAMPTDDRVFELESTPDPELNEQLLDTRLTSEATDTPMQNPDGSEARVSDVARHQRDEAEKRMTGMQTKIDDQMAECDAHGEYMKGIECATRLGTMIIKGPAVMPVVETRFVEQKDSTGSVWVQETTEKLKPVLRQVDPWNCYPAPGWDGEDAKKLSHHWEKGTITPGELRELRNLKDSLYIPEQIDKVLDNPPKTVQLTIEDGKQVVRSTSVQLGEAYETWEYHGDVDKDALEAMGRVVTNTDKYQRACVLFVGDVPIKATLYPADNMPIIYNYWQYSKVAGSPFGQGVPRSGKWCQAVIQGAFRGMADLALNISGGHLAVAVGNLEGSPERRGSITVWPVKRDVDINKVMAYYQTAGRPEIFMQMIEVALRFFDLETTTPTAFQGDKTTMPETLGATNILVDSGNAATEHRLGWLEKKIFTPVVKGFYTHNMLDPDCPNDIKGDYNVVVKGVKRLQNRELEAKMVKYLMGMLQDPELSIEYDKSKLAEKIFKMYRIDVRKSEADIKADKEKMAQNPPPVDPKVEAVNIRVKGEMEKAQLVQQSDMAELQAKGEEAERQREHERWEKQVEFQIKQMEVMAKLNESLEQIKAKLAEAGEKIALQRQLSTDKIKGAEQVSTPVAEPPQRAGAGRAFEE